jgi:hypothetical protein
VGTEQIYVQNAQMTVGRIQIYASTKSPIANRPSQQSLHHFGQQGEAFQTQEEPPKVMALQLSWLASHANHLCLPSGQRQPELHK